MGTTVFQNARWQKEVHESTQFNSPSASPISGTNLVRANEWMDEWMSKCEATSLVLILLSVLTSRSDKSNLHIILKELRIVSVVQLLWEP